MLACQEANFLHCYSFRKDPDDYFVCQCHFLVCFIVDANFFKHGNVVKWASWP